RAVDAGAKNIKLVLSASEGHSQANSDASIAEASDRLMDAANFARDQGLRFDITTAVSFICPFDGITEPDHLVEVLRPFVAAGAMTIKPVLPAAEGPSQANSDASIAEASDRLMDAAKFARDQGLRFDITTAVSFICPFDGITEPDHLVEVLRPFVAAGAHGIGVADTIGNANPSLVRRNT